MSNHLAKTAPCKELTAKGKPCEAPAGASGYCFHHDPARAAERHAARVKGGATSHVVMQAAQGKGTVDLDTLIAGIENQLGLVGDATTNSRFNAGHRGKTYAVLASVLLKAYEYRDKENRYDEVTKRLDLIESKAATRH